jgi:DNA-binding response OmpR family regulator
LLARIRALLRRAGETAGIVRHGPLLIDKATRRVMFASEPVTLRPREYSLLVHLARDPTRVHTKAELLRDLPGVHVGAVLVGVEQRAHSKRVTIMRNSA